MIETVDSLRLGQEIHKRCAAAGKVMPVLVEVNSGREANKSGVLPEEVDALIGQLGQLPYIRVQGLMTMGPRSVRPPGRAALLPGHAHGVRAPGRASLPHVEMRYLSMGMSNSLPGGHRRRRERGAHRDAAVWEVASEHPHPRGGAHLWPG